MGMTDAEAVERLRNVARWFGRRVDAGRGFAEPETSGRAARAAYDAHAQAACLRGAEAIEEVARLREALAAITNVRGGPAAGDECWEIARDALSAGERKER
jgi:hypothetical protein